MGRPKKVAEEPKKATAKEETKPAKAKASAASGSKKRNTKRCFF